MDNQERDYTVYLEERKSLIEANKNTAQQFDKAVLTLAAGALALSLTFIEKIAPAPVKWTLWFLAFSWIAFVISILSTLISFLTSQTACTRQIEIIENEDETTSNSEGSQNKYALYTKRLNISSIIFFIIGVALLVTFSLSNLFLYKQEGAMAEKKNINEGYVPQKQPITPGPKKTGDKGFIPPPAPKKPSEKK
ncbi:MAG: hypothetical protein WA666_05535 [Nitrospirota bacterium]